jgi:hypothetical protein
MNYYIHKAGGVYGTRPHAHHADDPPGGYDVPAHAYLAGKMRDVPYWNFPAFDEAAAILRAKGWTIHSPAEHDRELMAAGQGPAETPADGGAFELLESCLEWDLARIAESSCVIVLPGWETSTGCHWEFTVAHALGKPVFQYPELEPVKIPRTITHPVERLPETSHVQVKLPGWPSEIYGDESETTVVDPVTGGKKGQKVARMDLLPWDTLLDLSIHYGENSEKHGGKYPDRNWEKGYAWSLSVGALGRHLAAWLSGEEFDEEGHPHIRAIHWHAAALHAFTLRGIGTDDRQ